jgi:methyl coenzyme M reductase beta subunit
LPRTKQKPSGVSIEVQAGGAGLWEALEAVGDGAAAAAMYAEGVAPADKKVSSTFLSFSKGKLLA